ncbi:hypothetical protein JCM10207_004780 [Rhodosporidiobolus poonsookiae]
MPVPLLSLDLLPLIFRHLEDDLDELTKRTTAKRLMLVCKEWKPFAEELAFREVTLEPNRDDGLVDFLLRQKDLLRHLRELDLAFLPPILPQKKHGSVKGSRELDRSVQQTRRTRIVDLLSGCTGLQDMTLPFQDDAVDLILSAATSAFATALQCLSMSAVSGRAFSYLSNFRSLAELELVLYPLVIGEDLAQLSVETKIPVRTLGLMFLSSRNVMESFVLFLLKSLVIHMDAPNFVQAVLPTVLDVLPDLTALVLLIVAVLKKAIVDGVFFDLPPLPLFTPQSPVRNLPDTTLKVIGRFSPNDPVAATITSIEKPREVEVVHIKEDGAVGEEWKLVAGSFKFD